MRSFKKGEMTDVVPSGENTAPQTIPTVSVVIEASATNVEASDTGVIESLESLTQQSYSRENTEILVCEFGWADEAKQTVLNRFPGVKIHTHSTDGYFRLKNLGIKNARGDMIAFADSDVVYPPHWIASIVNTLESGADISVGITHYPGESLFRRLCAFYNQQHVLLRVNGAPRRFVSNNVGFKRDIFTDESYDERFDRSGGCVQLANRLVRRGFRFQLNPDQTAIHNFYNSHEHVVKRAFRNGYDLIYTRRLDPEMPLSRLVRLSFLAPPILIMLFFLSDLINLIQNRSLLAIQSYELPLFALFSGAVRLLEAAGMYWTLIHPKSIASYTR